MNAEEKAKPTSRPKFAAPASTKNTTQNGKVENIKEESRKLKKKTNKKQAISKKSTEKQQPRADKPKPTSLSDSQYDDIFASVTARVLAGDFLTLDDRFAGTEDMDLDGSNSIKNNNGESEGSNRETSKLTSAENFTITVSDKSPSLSKRTNEVTPLTSPLEENGESVLVKQPPPKKKEKKTREKSTKNAKRKSLEYSKDSNNHRVTGPNGNRIAKNMEIVECIKERGTWVQCNSCDKWRFLSDCQDPSVLPDKWICIFNSNKSLADCSAPEEDWQNSSQDSFIYTQFTPGSVVWAKMAGYPSWPAMVDIDPDFNTFYETFPNGEVSYYHVVFLDDRVSRAWISFRNIEAYRANETPVKLPGRTNNNNDFAKDMASARNRAKEATEMNISDRLQKFSFRHRFSGKSHWSRDKNTWERKLKRKAMTRKSKNCNIKDNKEKKSTKSTIKSVDFADFESVEKAAEEKNGSDDIGNKEKKKKDDSFVSGSEAEEAEDYWEKQNDEERILFGNMVIDEDHNRSDEIPYVGEPGKHVGKSLELDSEIFTMEAAKCPQNSCEVLDLSQKSKEKTLTAVSGMINNASEEEPLDLSGKKSEKITQVDRQSQEKNEYWLTPDKAVETESLFEDMEDVHMEDEALDQDVGQQQWEDFEKMVLME